MIKEVVFNSWKRWIGIAIATGFGAGFVPIAPGTAGSAISLPIAWFVFWKGGYGWLWITTLFTFIIGGWSARIAENLLECHDSPHIVVDEMAGQLLSLCSVPCKIPNMIVGFGWFRLFDSVKPWPAGRIDREMEGALGVMLDDGAAGIYANLVTAVMVHSGVIKVAMKWAGWGD